MSHRSRIAFVAAGLAALVVAVLWWPHDGAPAVGFVDWPVSAVDVATAEANATASAAVAAGEQTPASASQRLDVLATATTGSVLVRVMFHDRTPAAGLAVELARSGDVDSLQRPRGVTDDNGELRFADEAPGRVVPTTSRPQATGVRCEIVAGQEVIGELVVRRGIDARGIVVDGNGAPVAGAEVVAADWGGQQAHVLAHTAADGTFALRSLSTHCHIGARAPASCASSMHTVTAGEGAVVDLRIVLSEPGAVIAGLVLGPDGQPVADAIVRVGSSDQNNHKLPDGTQAMAPRPIAVRTQADGHFIATCLPAGSLPIAVLAAPLAPWQDTVEAASGERREVTVRLEQGVSLTGTVRDAAGTPVAKAMVRTGMGRRHGNQYRVSDAAGSFAFTGLPVGELAVSVDHDGLGKAETVLRGRAGEQLQWDPVLSNGLVVRGRVVDDADQPVVNAMIEAHAESGDVRWFSHPHSGEDGRFELKNCRPGVPIRISVRRHALRELQLRNVVPGPEELIVRLPAAHWVRIKGRALGPDGAPLPNVEVSVSAPAMGGGDLETVDPATGAFDIGPYPPGDLQLRLETPGFAMFFAHRRVQPDEIWDLGTVTFARGGTLELGLVADVPGVIADQFALVHDARGDMVTGLHIQKGRAVGGPWAEGSYTLQLAGEDFVAVRQPFAIRADLATRLDVPVTNGVKVAITFALPAGSFADSVSFELVDTNEAMIVGSSAWSRGESPAARLQLAPGRYRVRVTDVAFAGDGVVDVATPGPVAAAIELRSR